MAELVREYLIAGQLIDRSGMPHLISTFGRAAMAEIAIGEWMAASPIYTKRMQRLLGFEGDTVEVIFKGMQLDVGAPPEFMDFRYTVDDDHHGRFHLDHCGALMDVEPMGDDYVTAMCHHIEDPTFDATATATNARARMVPIHRPPRSPEGRTPHCSWTVDIDPTRDALPVPAQAVAMADSNAARLPLADRPTDLATTDGWSDYAGPLDPDLVMERFSSATLAAMAEEIALQGQMLARAYLTEVADRAAPDDARVIGIKAATGIAGLTTKRLARALGVTADLTGLAQVLAVHPLLQPVAYVGASMHAAGEQIELRLVASPGRNEVDGLSWPALLDGADADRIIETLAICLVPTARVERVTAPDDVIGWRITAPAGAEPTPEPSEVVLTEFSSGATFSFERRT